LRFHQLTSKSPWTDEFATLVFSLGNNFTSIPLNQIISSETLLQPLQINPNATISDVVNLLLNEDNHPPLYFVLLHLWLQLFSASGETVNLWTGRALPVLFGILAIPAFYFVTKSIFRSSLIAHFSALLIAVSPYSIFISQEARHYTCAVLLVILSLSCFLKSAQYLALRKKLPWSLILGWIILNSIGLSVHFFFGLAFLAEVMSLGILYFSQLRKDNNSNKSLKHWYSLLWVILGTGTTILTWFIIIFQREYGNGMTQWIQQDNSNIIRFISPIFQLAAAWVTMLCLLPIESPNLAIAILSGLGMLIYLIWYIPLIKWGLLQSWKTEKFFLETRMLVYCFMSLVMLYLGITYFGGKDITRGARYSFVYLPVITFLLTIVLSVCWERKEAKFNTDFSLKNILYIVKHNGKFIAYVVGLMGILSSLSIAHNLGYRKYYNPTQFLDILQANSNVPSLISTTQQSLVQTGEMMGLAWELAQNNAIAKSSKPDFLLIHQTQENSPETTEKLKAIIQKEKQNIDVWTVNFHAEIDLPNCSVDQQSFPGVNGYDYQLYHCQALL
ncbi:MAG: glycosyltransferase family 39 protein, partial [Snowella sp.]|nr:glycosyltransferase family 39 protein [Snowella sp.]